MDKQNGTLTGQLHQTLHTQLMIILTPSLQQGEGSALG